MKVLLVSHELSVTGAPNSLLRQAGYFKSAGFDVEVWTLADGPLRVRYEAAGFSPEVVPNNRQAILGRFAKTHVRYDLVVCNTIRTYRAVDVFRRQGLKVAWFVRETLLLDEDWWLNPDFADVFAGFGNLYTVSEYAADVVRRYNPHVRVIHNSVADVFRGFAPLGRSVRFGFIGSIIPAKGIDVLLDAFADVRLKFPAATLTIAGGSARDDFERLRAQTAGEPSVRWVGQVQADDKQSFFDSIDVLCVPSLDEPSGLTVIEGAMQGKAVITTDRTGANYLVDSTCGRIVRAGDRRSLAKALSELAGAGAKVLWELGHSARARYLRLGTPAEERAAVLRMVEECRAEPPVRTPLHDDSAKPLFHVTRYLDGRCRVYFRGLRLFSFRGKGVSRR